MEPQSSSRLDAAGENTPEASVSDRRVPGRPRYGVDLHTPLSLVNDYLNTHEYSPAPYRKSRRSLLLRSKGLGRIVGIVVCFFRRRRQLGGKGGRVGRC